jgi:hypothetical protein
MQDDLVEAVILGTVIGGAVLAIRALMGSTPSQPQMLVLLLVGVVLVVVQFMLSLRRSRRNGPPHDHTRGGPHRLRRRMERRSPFMHELTNNWTGLDDHIPSVAPAPPQGEEQLVGDEREGSGDSR